jgi:hypothetical protein
MLTRKRQMILSMLVLSTICFQAFGEGPSGPPACQTGSSSDQIGFSDCQYFYKSPGDSKARPIKGSLIFDPKGSQVGFFSEGSNRIDIPYSNITTLLYERTSKPRYALGLLVAWPLLFTKSKKHYLTVQYKSAEGQGQYALFQLDKENYQRVLATAESQTGKKVERSEEK